MDRTLATCRYKTYRPILARQFVVVQLRRTRDRKFAVLDAAPTPYQRGESTEARRCAGSAGEMTDVVHGQQTLSSDLRGILRFTEWYANLAESLQTLTSKCDGQALYVHLMFRLHRRRHSANGRRQRVKSGSFHANGAPVRRP
jgi:hypothetical protein